MATRLKVNLLIRVKPGCHLHKYARKCARIYTLAVQLEKWQIFMQVLQMLLLTRIYASGSQA
jgi:hypothetical protein